MSALDPAALEGVTILSTCTAEQLAKVAAAGEVTTHPPGANLTQEGAMGHRFHLILDGTVEVEQDGRTLISLGRGEFVGEIGLLGGGPSTATVRCTSPTTCLTIWRQRFWELLESEPAIALRILEVLCRRLERERLSTPVGNLIKV
jgi:CRP/FNR family cyclic AMP-dependent transcriptional regulator